MEDRPAAGPRVPTDRLGVPRAVADRRRDVADGPGDVADGWTDWMRLVSVWSVVDMQYCKWAQRLQRCLKY